MTPEQTAAYYRDNQSARWIALLAVGIGSFITPLTLSAVHVATPAIAQSLDADARYISWIPTVFLICNAITLLPVGRLADTWGRKRMYLIGCIWFMICSVLTALAPTIELLLVARGLQGLSASMVFGPTIAIVTSVFGDKQRGTALGLISATIYLGLTCGPAVGGWLTDGFGWRSVFLFPVPLLMLTFWLLLAKLKGDWRIETQQTVDWLGSALFAAGIIVMFWGLSHLPAPDALLAVLVAGLFFVGFVKQQGRAQYPLLRIKTMWGNKEFMRSLMTSLLMYSATYPIVFVLSLYLQFIQGMSAGEAGQLILIQAVVMAIVAPLAGRLSDRYQPRIIASIGCFIVAMGISLFQILDMDSANQLIIIALGVIGVGFGLFSTPNNSAAIGVVRIERLGIASAVLTLSRVTGNMLGTGVLVLLMNLMIGQQTIVPELHPVLLAVIKIVLGCSFVFAIAGACCSLPRRKHA